MRAILANVLGSPWTLVALFVIGATSGWYVNGWRHDAAQTKAVEAALEQQQKNYDIRDTNYKTKLAAVEKLAAANAKARDSAKEERDRFQADLQHLQLTEHRERKVTDETGTHTCIDVRRGTAYRVCINAAITGDPAAIVNCKADGRYGDVQDKYLPSP